MSYQWLLIVITILLSAFFSGAEIAFVTANKLKLEVASKKNNLVSKAIGFFAKKPEKFLTTTLVGNNIVNVLYATLMALFLAKPIEYYWDMALGNLPSAYQVLIIQTIVASILIMIFGEILPKAIFRSQADIMIAVVALPLRILNIVLRPLIVLANGSSNVLIKWIAPGAKEAVQLYRREDIALVFKELSEAGGSEEIDKDDSEILHNVLELSNKRVRDSMIPRTEIKGVEKSATIEEVANIFIESGHSKLPVYRESIDDVIGIVSVHDFFKNPKTLHEIIRPVKLVPTSKKSKTLMTEFRKTNSSIAIVLDEYGGTAGMVTIEDLLEEVVGDIQDEHDVDDEIMKRIAPNTFIISGNVEIDELNEVFNEIEIPIEPSEYDTVAGYIINHLGRIPTVNEQVQIDNYTFDIMKATQSRIETVKLVILD